VTRATDVIVVVGGIMGLAFAWEAARHGRRVTLLERSDAARGASIRNFGMVWPVGQPAGELHGLAMRSRARWLALRDAETLWARECGSVHVVLEDDEAAVLTEFATRAPDLGVPCELPYRRRGGPPISGNRPRRAGRALEPNRSGRRSAAGDRGGGRPPPEDARR
jgi:glycine/D-amino acid oxidase-like deaminating enzyme